jgi:hypothetical protein
MNEDSRIIRNRKLNNLILDLESQKHKISMQIKKLEQQIEKNW